MTDQTPPKDNSSGSEARVAFDLMVFIAEHEAVEDSKSNDPKKSRDYWFTLYVQCRMATKGNRTPREILAFAPSAGR